MKHRRTKGCLVIVAVLAASLAALYFAGHLIDPRVALETERHIDASPSAVFRYVGTPEGVVEWWSSMSGPHREGMEVVANGDGVDFLMDGSVAEEWRLRDASEPRLAVWTVDFQIFEVTRRLAIEPEGEGSRVVWSEQGWIHNPAARYMTIVMSDEDTTRNFDMALEALAEVARAPR